MNPIEILSRAEQDGRLELQPGLTEGQIQAFEARLPGPIREPVRGLLGRTRGFEVAPVGLVDLAGGAVRGMENVFEHTVTVARHAEGAWVVDISNDGRWGPVFYVHRQPPVMVLQARRLAEFLVQVLEEQRCAGKGPLAAIVQRHAAGAWQKPALMSRGEAASRDRELAAFAASLTDRHLIADLRGASPGAGFPWAGPYGRVPVERHGLIFALEAKSRSGLLGWLLGG